jgi:hypothetical protein
MSFDLGVLGEMAGADDAVLAAETFLRTWLPSAVLAVNADGYNDEGGMVAPMVYARIPVAVIERNADQVPAIYVSSPGTVGDPIVNGSGESYSVWYTVNVTALDRGEDWATTTRRAQIWGGLIRSVMLATKNLNGRVRDIKWGGESFGPIDAEDGRTLSGVTVSFRVLLPVFVRGSIGPFTVPPVAIDPVTGLPPTLLPDGPVVATHEEDIEDGPL